MQPKTVLLSCHPFPCIGYISQLIKRENVLIEWEDNFQKQSFRSRYQILSPQGILNLNIPTIHGESRIGNKRRISYAEDWQKDHWKSIYMNYRSSPYFEFYEPYLEPLFKEKEEFLYDFNLRATKIVLKLLDIEKEILPTKEYHKEVSDNVLDLRIVFDPKSKANSNDFIKTKEYQQVFSDKTGFIQNLSILDLLFCEGPQAIIVLNNI